jgi:hypothetical protein
VITGTSLEDTRGVYPELLPQLDTHHEWSATMETVLHIPSVDHTLQQTPALGVVNLVAISSKIVAAAWLFTRTSNEWFSSVAA